MTFRQGPQDTAAILRDAYEHIRRLEKQFTGLRELLPDAKGDLKVGLRNDVWNLLEVGTDGQFLIADSTEDLGVKWDDFGTTAGEFDCIVDHDLVVSNPDTLEYKTFAEAFAAIGVDFTLNLTRMRIYLRTASVAAFGESATVPASVVYLYIRGRAEMAERRVPQLASLTLTGGALSSVVLDSVSTSVMTCTGGNWALSVTRCYIGNCLFGTRPTRLMSSQLFSTGAATLGEAYLITDCEMGGAYSLTYVTRSTSVIVGNRCGTIAAGATTFTFAWDGNDSNNHSLIFAGNTGSQGGSGSPIVLNAGNCGALVVDANTEFSTLTATLNALGANPGSPVCVVSDNACGRSAMAIDVQSTAASAISMTGNKALSMDVLLKAHLVEFSDNTLAGSSAAAAAAYAVRLKSYGIAGPPARPGLVVANDNVLRVSSTGPSVVSYLLDIGADAYSANDLLRVNCNDNVASWFNSTGSYTTNQRGIRLRDGITINQTKHNIIDSHATYCIVNEMATGSPVFSIDQNFCNGVYSGITGGSPGAGHVIQEDSTPLTQRTNLNFQDGLIATDDAGNDQSDVNVDYATTTEIADIAATEAAGTSTKLSRGDHVHAHPVFASGDFHSEYQKESEKSATSGYASLDAGTRVPTPELGTGTATVAEFLRGDQTWSTHEAYTITNDSADRVFDADTATLSDVADVLATLLRDLAAGKTPSV